MKYRRQTKIICTLGPASEDKEIITQLAQNGMDMARLNFSHGDHAYHQRLIETIRDINQRRGMDIKILQDLEGYRIRVGQLARPLPLQPGQNIDMVHEGGKIGKDDLPLDLDLEADFSSFTPGMLVFIDDGKICLEVVKSTAERIRLLVRHEGVVQSRKGVNIPDLRLRPNIMTQKDQEDLAFGIRHQVDCVAQSFVRNKQDILRVRRMVERALPDCQIFAKIENHQGVDNLDSIMDACAGILIARGDLGVSLPIYKIPIIQKSIIRRCNKRKKYSMTATQMLESMTEHQRPTRAEVSDIANAILDGTDYVMLSGETAAGQFPVDSVRMMRQVVEYTEQSMSLRE